MTTAAFWLCVWVFILSLLFLLAARAAEPMAKLILRPQIMMARSDVHVTIVLAEHSPAKGSWTLTWDSVDAGSGSSARTYTDKDSLVQELYLRDLPAADWLFELRLFDEKGTQRFVTTERILAAITK